MQITKENLTFESIILRDRQGSLPDLYIWSMSLVSDRLCGLVARVLGYRSGDPETMEFSFFFSLLFLVSLYVSRRRNKPDRLGLVSDSSIGDISEREVLGRINPILSFGTMRTA
jgi:hypothetical protein